MAKMLVSYCQSQWSDILSDQFQCQKELSLPKLQNDQDLVVSILKNIVE